MRVNIYVNFRMQRVTLARSRAANAPDRRPRHSASVKHASHRELFTGGRRVATVTKTARGGPEVGRAKVESEPNGFGSE